MSTAATAVHWYVWCHLAETITKKAIEHRSHSLPFGDRPLAWWEHILQLPGVLSLDDPSPHLQGRGRVLHVSHELLHYLLGTARRHTMHKNKKQGGPENPKARRHTARLFLKMLWCGQCSGRNRCKIFTETSCALMVSGATIRHSMLCQLRLHSSSRYCC